VTTGTGSSGSRYRCRHRVVGSIGWSCCWRVARIRCSRWRRRGRCIGRGRRRSSGAGRGRCGRSRRQRPRRLGRSWGRAGLRPTIAIARRWSGSRAKASVGQRQRPGSRRYWGRCRIVGSALKPLRQRLHDQLNALAPGLSASPGHGRQLALDTPTGWAVLCCAAAFAGRPPTVRSLKARAPGRLGDATARFWVERWKACLATAGRRVARCADDARPGPLRRPARRHRLRRRPARAAARRQPRPDPDHAAWSQDGPRRRVCRAHPPDRALPHPRAALLGDRARSGQL